MPKAAFKCPIRASTLLIWDYSGLHTYLLIKYNPFAALKYNNVITVLGLICIIYILMFCIINNYYNLGDICFILYWNYLNM